MSIKVHWAPVADCQVDLTTQQFKLVPTRHLDTNKGTCAQGTTITRVTNRAKSALHRQNTAIYLTLINHDWARAQEIHSQLLTLLLFQAAFARASTLPTPKMTFRL